MSAFFLYRHFFIFMHLWYHTIDNVSLQDLLLYTFYFMLFHIRIGHFCHGFNNISRNVSDKFVYVSVMLTTSYMSVALLSITNRSINHFNNTQVYSSDTQRLLWFSPFWHLHPSIPFVSKKKCQTWVRAPSSPQPVRTKDTWWHSEQFVPSRINCAPVNKPLTSCGFKM